MLGVRHWNFFLHVAPQLSFKILTSPHFYHFFCGPHRPSNRAAGLVAQAAAVTPPLGGGFLATSVVPIAQFLIHSAPLLPHFNLWPFVWPEVKWTPPELPLKLCPKICVGFDFWKCLFCFIGLFCGTSLLILAYTCPIYSIEPDSTIVGPT